MPTIKLSELEELINENEISEYRNKSEKEKKIEKERRKRFKQRLDKE